MESRQLATQPSDPRANFILIATGVWLREPVTPLPGAATEISKPADTEQLLREELAPRLEIVKGRMVGGRTSIGGLAAGRGAKPPPGRVARP